MLQTWLYLKKENYQFENTLYEHQNSIPTVAEAMTSKLFPALVNSPVVF